MEEYCTDVFERFNLPFKTNLSNCINHDFISHDEMEIIWLLKGEARVIIDNKELVMTNQTVLLIFMNKEHSIKTTKDSIVISYRLNNEHIQKNNLNFMKLKYKSEVLPFSYLIQKYHEVPLLILQIIKLLVSNENSEIHRYKIIGYYTIYIYELYNMILKEQHLDIKTYNMDSYLNRIYVIIEYIYQNYNKKISIQELAEKVKISVYRLSHFFTETFGISYIQFLQSIRFEYALKLLKNTDLPISEIVQLCGFSDHKFLNRMMHQTFHMTPLQYRKQTEYEHRSPIYQSQTSFIEELKTCIKNMEQDHLFSNLNEIKFPFEHSL